VPSATEVAAHCRPLSLSPVSPPGRCLIVAAPSPGACPPVRTSAPAPGHPACGWATAPQTVTRALVAQRSQKGVGAGERNRDAAGGALTAAAAAPLPLFPLRSHTRSSDSRAPGRAFAALSGSKPTAVRRVSRRVFAAPLPSAPAMHHAAHHQLNAAPPPPPSAPFDRGGERGCLGPHRLDQPGAL
jgi:hypothetical protein